MTDERETKQAWAVLVNTDLTEGRGSQYVKHICDMEATAVRLARKADVQGTDGTVMQITLEKRHHTWLGPVNVEQASAEDKKTQLYLDAQRAAEERARALGMTDDELAILRRSRP